MNISRFFLLFGWLALSVCACADQAPAQGEPPRAESDSQVTLSASFPYDFQQPKRYMLPAELGEVSGMSWAGENQVVLVEDEHALIYQFDLSNQTILQKHDFGKDGDYEGIELVGDTVYVLKSNGNLYEVPGFPDQWQEKLKFESDLNGDDDTEGLAYHPATDQLLIVPKEPLREGEEYVKQKRVVYAFDLTMREINPTPLLALDMQGLRSFAEEQSPDQAWVQDIRPDKKGSFKPSGLAVHPISGHFYWIASAGQLMVVTDQAGNFVAVQHLPRNPFIQPEGICFDPAGNLYISNEGRDGIGTILRFAYQPK
ncbi:MAG: SdiA-regulated domain-containing protein [Bacteroidota bacterium]